MRFANGSADGMGTAASFNSPVGLGLDAEGNVFVADTGNNSIRKINPAGAVTTFAGTAGAPGSADGTGAAASFNSPQGIAVDAAGNVYVADTGNNLIREITSARVVTTYAGALNVNEVVVSGSILYSTVSSGVVVWSPGSTSCY